VRLKGAPPKRGNAHGNRNRGKKPPPGPKVKGERGLILKKKGRREPPKQAGNPPKGGKHRQKPPWKEPGTHKYSGENLPESPP